MPLTPHKLELNKMGVSELLHNGQNRKINQHIHIHHFKILSSTTAYIEIDDRASYDGFDRELNITI
jgi:hypothetical protein